MSALDAPALARSVPARFAAPRHRLFDSVVLLIAAGILVAFRLHAFALPLENDECNYAYIAKRLLLGDRLYVDVWDHQPFGVFAMLTGVIAIFGDAPHVFRWTACAFSLVSLTLIFDIARRVAGRSAGVVAALLFALVSSDPGTAGEGCQREIYMNTLILAAWWFSWRAFQPRRNGPSDGPLMIEIVIAGAALGVASTLKTVVAVHWVLLLGWLLWMTLNQCNAARFRRSVASIAAFGAGPAIIWLTSFAYFAATGRWDEFLDAVFLFNVGYSESSGLLSRFAEFFAPLWHRFIAPTNPPPRFPFTFDSALPLWILGFVSTPALTVVCILRPRRVDECGPASCCTGLQSAPPTCGTDFSSVRRNAYFLLALVAASYLAVCLPGRFWPHYYHLMIPPLVLVTAIAPIALCQRWARPTVCVVTMALILAGTAYFQYRHYLSQPLFDLTVNRFNSRDFWGRAQGENVASVTHPDDKIFVFGNDAEIYYYANRRCASRYTMLTGVSARMPGADRRRQLLLDDLRRDPPRLILVLFDEPPFQEWLDFLNEHYGDPVGWDFHDRTRKPILFVLARKDRPVKSINWDWDRAFVNGWAIGERSEPRP